MSAVVKRVFEWEPIPGDATCESHRLWVTGGWIVRSKSSGYHMGAAMAQTFVKDENHSWKLSDQRKKREEQS